MVFTVLIHGGICGPPGVPVPNPLRYALALFGIVDLLALLPTYLALFVRAHVLIDVRVLRLMRIFRSSSSPPT